MSVAVSKSIADKATLFAVESCASLLSGIDPKSFSVVMALSLICAPLICILAMFSP